MADRGGQVGAILCSPCKHDLYGNPATWPELVTWSVGRAPWMVIVVLQAPALDRCALYLCALRSPFNANWWVFWGGRERDRERETGREREG